MKKSQCLGKLGLKRGIVNRDRKGSAAAGRQEECGKSYYGEKCRKV
jgi:hypothetical protein